MVKILKNISDGFKKVSNSKNVKEMVINTPWSFPEFLIFAGMFLLMLLPIYQIKSYYELGIYSYHININMMHEMCSFLGILAALIIFAKNRVEKSGDIKFFDITTVFFGLMIIFMIISTMVNGFTEEAVYGERDRNESLFTYIIYFAVYFYLSSIIRNKKFRSLLIYAFMSTSVFLAVLACVHTAFPIPLFYNSSGVALVFFNSNHYGYYLVLAILLSAVLFIKEEVIGLRIFCIISFALNTAVLVINNTFGGFLACFLALIFSVIVLSICEKRLNKLSILVFALFILITSVMSIWFDTVISSILVFITDIGKILENAEDAENAGTNRWKLWTLAVGYISEKPLFGYGVEGSNIRFINDGCTQDRPHCEFLQYAAFFGIPAAISYICGMFSVYLNGLKKRYKLDKYAIAALVAAFGYLVSSSFGNTTFYVSPYFFIILGIGCSNREKT